MLIEFLRSGGFANLPLKLTLDTDALSPEQRHEVAAKVDAADFFRLPSRQARTSPTADAFQYRVKVISEGREHSVEIAGPPPSEAVQEMLDYLTDAAKKARTRAVHREALHDDGFGSRDGRSGHRSRAASSRPLRYSIGKRIDARAADRRHRIHRPARAQRARKRRPSRTRVRAPRN